MENDSVPIFAINLDASADRWASVKDRCAALGLELQRVPALDGRSIAEENRTGFDALEFRKHTGRFALPGEYGCYRSHLLALQTFLDSGAPFGLIIEDDVLPNGETAGKLAAIIAELPGFDVVRLISHRSRGFVEVLTTSLGDQVGRTLFGPQGSAAAYLVSREGARKILAALAVMVLPWDIALERFWHSETGIYSTHEDVLEFSPHRAASNIISKNGYADSKLSWVKRFSAFSFQLAEGFRRAHAVLLAPQGAKMASVGDDRKPLPPPGYGRTSLLAIAGLMIFMSAMWIETDAYRFAGIAMLLAALIHYFRKDFLTYSKVLIGPVGILCMLWALYVATRMGIDYAARPGKGFGTAEGVYLLPMLYPTFGYALFLGIRKPFAAVVCFMAISLAVLLIGTDYEHALAGQRAVTFLHNNNIHAANAAGILMICAVAFSSYVLHCKDISGRGRTAMLLLAAGVFALAGLNAVSLFSKGVWVGLALSMPALLLMIAANRRASRNKLMAVAALAVLAAGTLAFAQNFRGDGEKTAGNAATLVSQILSGEPIVSVVSSAIANPGTAPGVRQRLMIWSNGAEVWAQHPVFGAGVAWLDDWDQRTYKSEAFTLLHNGYLEIAVRYGVIGLLFYGFLFAWSLATVRNASKAGLIDITAYHAHLAVMILFAVSLFTNSNNRLAFGESYMWFAVSFGFYCYYLLQVRGLVKVRTYF